MCRLAGSLGCGRNRRPASAGTHWCACVVTNGQRLACDTATSALPRTFTLQCRYITMGWVMAEVQTLPLTSSTAICCAASLSRAEASTNCRFRSLQMVWAGGRWKVRCMQAAANAGQPEPPAEPPKTSRWNRCDLQCTVSSAGRCRRRCQHESDSSWIGGHGE